MKIAIPLALALIFTSCSTFRKVVDNIADNEALVGPTVSLITSVVFEKAVSDEDKAEKAAIVSKVAEKLNEIELTAKPTRAEFETLLSSSLPSKSHWTILVVTLGSYYEKATVKLSDSDVTGSLALIKQIAAGMSVASARYLE